MNRHPAWFDPGDPRTATCVTAQLLERGAEAHPDRVFAVLRDGDAWTYQAILLESQRRAAGLFSQGVRPGDPVCVFLPNGIEALLAWFSINLLGAVFVPLNPAYRGGILTHAITLSGAKLMIAHDRLIERVCTLEDHGELEVVVSTSSDTQHASDAFMIRPSETLRLDPEQFHQADCARMPWDLQSILFTSGTTGPSKGVLSSHVHLHTAANALFGYMSEDDRIFVNAPIHHLGAPAAIHAALAAHASIAFVDGFNARTFWEEIKDTGATITSGLLGSMTTLLAQHSESETIVESSLRRTHLYPVSEDTVAFANRFGFEYYSGYGTTEVPLPLVTDLNTSHLGSCGRPRTGVTCRLVDDHDLEVEQGSVGELVIRPDEPWSITHGYHGMAEATANAWRNGWFHTGDLMRQDESGSYYFVDRKKDAIRRRGENISSHEIEMAVLGNSGVGDVVAIGVPAELGEEEVLIVIEPSAGETIDCATLFGRLVEELPHFMLPRYIRVVDKLPRTPTEKPQKYLLRDEGVTEDTWDREAAGIQVRRMKLD